MDQSELLKFIAELFDKLGINYMVVGSYASMYYGEMRNTNDIDVVADLAPEHISGLLEGLPSPAFYVSGDAIREAVRDKSQFNIIHAESMSKIDVYLTKPDDYSRAALADSLKVSAFGREIRIARPEHVILNKLKFYREGGSEKHLRDIASMLKLSGNKIDLALVNDGAGKTGLGEIWRDFLKKYQDKA